jgi:hypothetical protein
MEQAIEGTYFVALDFGNLTGSSRYRAAYKVRCVAEIHGEPCGNERIIRADKVLEMQACQDCRVRLGLCKRVSTTKSKRYRLLNKTERLIFKAIMERRARASAIYDIPVDAESGNELADMIMAGRRDKYATVREFLAPSPRMVETQNMSITGLAIRYGTEGSLMGTRTRGGNTVKRLEGI